MEKIMLCGRRTDVLIDGKVVAETKCDKNAICECEVSTSMGLAIVKAQKTYIRGGIVQVPVLSVISGVLPYGWAL